MNRFDEEIRKRTAAYSLISAMGVSVLLLAVWLLSKSPPAIPAVQRPLSAFQVEWVCPDGTSMMGPGGIQGPPCLGDQRRAVARVEYVCPTHGTHRAFVRYVRQGRRERLAEIGFRWGVWRPVGDGIRCPTTGVPLMPKIENPFAEAARKNQSSL